MFNGFSQKTIDFMWGIRLNNNREWFLEHKDEYRSDLEAPMKALAEDVANGFAKKQPKLGLELHVSRIYRDARRLFGNGPYKDHLWFTLRKVTLEWTDKPVFWFELGPENISYGLGYYQAAPITMQKLRARIDKDPAPLKKLSKALATQKEFVLEGESYKKPKCAEDEPLSEWYNLKSFSLIHTENLSADIFSPSLADRIVDGYDFLTPFYNYFATLDDDPDPNLR